MDPEEHSVSSQSQPAKPKTPRSTNKILLGIVGVIVLCGLSFYGGVSYQKHHVKTSAPTSQFGNRGAGFGGGQGGSRRQMSGGVGAVTAVSSTSITVNNPRNNTAKTYTINSSTSVTSDGSTAAVSDIKVGDTVFVQTSTSDKTVAARILLNPSFGGGQGSSTDSGSGTDDAQTN